MIKTNFLKAQQKTRIFLKKTNTLHHMFYGPISDEYYSNPIKILLINMEPYGYEECGNVDIDEKTLFAWLQDAGKTNTRTVRYSMAFTQVLLNCIHKKNNANRHLLKQAYKDVKELKNTAKRIVYYNIRPTSNSNKSQDSQKIIESGLGDLSKHIFNEMNSLEPTIIIVGGKAGLKAFNSMWGTKVVYKELYQAENGILIQSIRHPSRPKYEEYVQNINNITEEIKKWNL